jgi:hypothetical protein
VPFDIAFSLPAEDRLAWIIALGRLDGGEFDFTRMEWSKRA